MLQSKLLISAFCITSIATLAGCGTTILSHRDTNPVIEDHAKISSDKTNVFATTASRRLAFITMTKNSEGKGNQVICSEPPPDVGEAFASAIAAGLSGAVTAINETGQKVSGELAAQYGRAVATQIAPLLYRSQGLQLYRDAMYKLCIDKMNGWLPNKEGKIKVGDQEIEYKNVIEYYDLKSMQIFDSVANLIDAEIKNVMKEATAAFYLNVKAGDAKVNVEDIVKILQAQENKKE